ncbi:hypothetical protein Sjap_007146 [Stephania japonica]|uniref:Uncharacterized protein n=1 Tax=Stephania japonica TaxID=461633 RepID=A0AAP0PA59_9MAGN
MDTFSVTRLAGTMVRPSEPTPTGSLGLSSIDKALRFRYRILCVFRYGNEKAIEMMKKALAKALVPYYPFAGRLQESSHDDDDDGHHGELHISCTGEGVWFVEASADCSLVDVNYFDDAPLEVHEKLMPNPTPETMALDPVLQVQITSFKGGGFVAGLVVSHSLCDGMGLAQFVHAVNELAMGLKRPSVEPVWLRESILPSPSQVTKKQTKAIPAPHMPNYQLKYALFDVPRDAIDHLKREFSQSTGGETCTAFEVISAVMWRSRTRAINMPDSATVKLIYYANIRHLLDPPVPQGFYGNCIFPVTTAISSGWLKEASVGEVIKLVKDTKARLPSNLNKWINKSDHGEDHTDLMEEPFSAPLDYATFCLSGVEKLSKDSTDFGWGQTLHSFPIGLNHVTHPFVFLCAPPQPKTGIRLKTWCVEESHMPALHDELKIMLTNFNGTN